MISCSGNKDKNYSCLDDAAKDRIGVLMGTTQDNYITKNFPQATVVRADSFTDMLLSLKGDKCDVIAVDASVYKALCKVEAELCLLDENLYEGPIALGFNPKNRALREEFNKMLAELRADGTYDEIYDRWVNKPNPTMPVFDVPTTGTPLRVGVASSLPPCDYYQDGESVGLDSELARRLGQRLGRPVQFQIISFGGLIAAISSDKVDVIAAGLSVTPERAKNIAFADPHYLDITVSATLKKNIAPATGYHNINEMGEKRIGVMLGSTQDAYVTEKFPNATIVRVNATTDLKLALKEGKCDVIVLDTLVTRVMYKDDPSVCVLDSELFKGVIALGFSLENTALRDEFNKMLAEFRKDGTYDQIYDRWLNQPSPVMPAFDMPTTGTPLRIAVSSAVPPFDYYENGENIGFDSELVRRFAQRLGRPVQFQIINFGGLIAAISSGKVDIIASGLIYTAERAKNVAFADAHYAAKTVSVILRENLAATTKSTDKKYATKEDVSKKRIAVMMGSIHDVYATRDFPDATIIREDSYAGVLMELISKKSDVALFNKTVYTYLKKSNPQIEMLDSALYEQGSGIGFSYKQNELKEQFNTYLKEIRESKLYDQIYDRWVYDGESAEMPEIKLPTSGKPLRVGVSGSTIPSTFIRDGQHVGFDIEIVLRFAQVINRPVEFSIINFGGLIAALASDNVDMIAADIAITEDRVKQVNFSDVYFTNSSVMVVLNENLAGYDVKIQQGVEKQGFFASIGDSFYNNLIVEKRYMLILKGLWQTLIISVFAALLGTILGALVCFMRMSKNVALNTFAKGYITIMRGIPVLVMLMLLYYAVFAKWDISATIVAILTFALNFAAYVSEMFRTSIQGVDRGQNEAGIAMGFTKVQTFIFVIMPQAIKSVLPVYKGELISLVKMTSVVGYIAVEDLTKASDIIRSRTFDAFFPLVMVAVIYFLLAWGFTAILDSINKKMTTR